MNMPQAQSESTEAELIRRACDGSRKAFEELVHPYERLVFGIAIGTVRNEGDAEEVAQEAVLQAFTKLSSIPGGMQV
jgi:RNA polymerase sigma-70 factor, ECF subfamily